MRVALLGATGHVGRVLTVGLGAREDMELVLLGRRPQVAAEFAESQDVRAAWRAAHLSEAPTIRADAFVECLGSGDPSRLPEDVLDTEARFDALFLSCLRANEGSRGIAFSSGVVYHSDFQEPASAVTPLRSPDSMPATRGEAYALAKARAEARHRALPSLPIIDLRLFGLFSRFVDRTARYLMNDVVDALESGDVLNVSPGEIVRDYVAPTDLARLVADVLGSPPMNRGLDVFSACPVARGDLLAYLGDRYGLAYTTVGGRELSPTGIKPNYYSTDRRATEVGYRPTRSSLETLAEEIDALLEPGSGGTE